MTEWINKIICGENLEVLKQIPDNFIDLIYIDPPFFTQEDYNDFGDKWNNLDEYLKFMQRRIQELYRILKSTGTFYLHCDCHANAYLRILCDQIFGYTNFHNEIIWKRTNSPKAQTEEFGKQHDTILFYSKSKTYVYHKIYKPIKGKSLDPYIYNDNDGKGKYRLIEIIANGTQNWDSRKELVWHGYKAKYLYTEDNLNKMHQDGVIYISKNGRPSKKQYLSEMQGIVLSDIWTDNEVSPLQGLSEEYQNYSTQKPESLLIRIIKASSNENDLILDCFCGSGTTLVVSKSLNRKYIGIDKNSNAIDITNNRLKLVIQYKTFTHLLKKGD